MPFVLYEPYDLSGYFTAEERNLILTVRIVDEHAYNTITDYHVVVRVVFCVMKDLNTEEMK